LSTNPGAAFQQRVRQDTGDVMSQQAGLSSSVPINDERLICLAYFVKRRQAAGNRPDPGSKTASAGPTMLRQHHT